ncbi:MAG: TIGR03619 family F420-dependent LLM class oxidoreductase [Dehalococcoidia bacterium]|nr:TIGR03619 family F420-dependent LLM class oxidoreductase [Dehalococcoidia bacterium]
MSVRVGLGFAGLPFSSAAALRAWIDFCEGSQVDSVWLSERLVSPQPFLEPISALAVIAGQTERLKFGVNATVLPLRDPLVLARECATIDYLSGGRLLPVFGVGRDTAPEFKATNRSPAGRGERSNEMIQLLSLLWSGESVTFEGKHYQYRDVMISPPPVQQPLPLWIGGSSRAAIERTARWGTGWLGGIQDPSEVAPVIAAIKEAAAEAGRVIDEDHYGTGFPFRFGSWDEPLVERYARSLSRTAPDVDPRSHMVVGGAAEIADRIGQFIAAGASKFVLRPIAEGDAEIMDQSRRLNDEVLPLVHA